MVKTKRNAETGRYEPKVILYTDDATDADENSTKCTLDINAGMQVDIKDKRYVKVVARTGNGVFFGETFQGRTKLKLAAYNKEERESVAYQIYGKLMEHASEISRAGLYQEQTQQDLTNALDNTAVLKPLVCNAFKKVINQSPMEEELVQAAGAAFDFGVTTIGSVAELVNRLQTRSNDFGQRAFLLDQEGLGKFKNLLEEDYSEVAGRKGGKNGETKWTEFEGKLAALRAEIKSRGAFLSSLPQLSAIRNKRFIVSEDGRKVERYGKKIVAMERILQLATRWVEERRNNAQTCIWKEFVQQCENTTTLNGEVLSFIRSDWKSSKPLMSKKRRSLREEQSPSHFSIAQEVQDGSAFAVNNMQDNVINLTIDKNSSNPGSHQLQERVADLEKHVDTLNATINNMSFTPGTRQLRARVADLEEDKNTLIAELQRLGGTVPSLKTLPHGTPPNLFSPTALGTPAEIFSPSTREILQTLDENSISSTGSPSDPRAM